MNSSVKCVRDIRDIPPQAYRLASDGRKADHMMRLRHSLVSLLATYADGDGSNIHPAGQTLANALGVSRRTVIRLLDDIRQLGIMNAGDLTGFKGTRRRSLNVAAIQALGTVAPDSTPVAPDTHSQLRQIRTPVASNSAPVAPDSTTVAPHKADFGAQPSVRTYPRPTTTTTGPSDRPAKPQSENSNTVEEEVSQAAPDGAGSHEENNWCSGCGKPLPENQEYCNEDCEHEAAMRDLNEEEQRNWNKFLAALPAPMAHATWLKGQQEDVRRYWRALGSDVFQWTLAAWLMYRELPVDGLKANRWGKFLEEYRPYEQKVRKEYPTVLADWKRWGKDAVKNS